VVETVFRTNVHAAYNAGQFEEFQDPDVKRAFPLLKYRTVGDDRVREAHAELEGVILPADDPFWDHWWPPNGFNCRCSIEPLTKNSASTAKVTSRNQIMRATPDPGFDGPPTRQSTAQIENLKARAVEMQGELASGHD
jgi:SPP1 gp7 family putative phage head morphogenesis protein